MAKEKGIGLAALKQSLAADSKIPDEAPLDPVSVPASEPDGVAVEASETFVAEQTLPTDEKSEKAKTNRPKPPAKTSPTIEELLRRLEVSPKREVCNVRFPVWLNDAMVAHIKELQDVHDRGESVLLPTKQSLVTEAVLRLLHERGKLG